MSIDESKYPTMRLMRCKRCGSVYPARVAGATECPECASKDASQYRPDGAVRNENGQPGEND